MQQQPDNVPKTSAPSATNPCGQNVERLRYIEHRGKRILLADVSACTDEQLAECIKAVPEYVTKLPEHSVLLLGDFTGTHFTKETIEQLKIAAVFDRPHVARAAWVLNHNLHEVLLESIRNFSGREIAVFATREEALDYLAE
jgi:hypothetical protein